MKYSRGSEWRKWDLHVHTPDSALNNQFTNWNDYISKLESIRDHAVLGITDYFSIDGYKQVLNYRSQGKLTNFDLILPNIEIRILPVTSNEKPINLHLIFSDLLKVSDLVDFLKELKFDYKHNSYSCETHKLIELGRAIDPNLSEKKAYIEGINQFKTDITKLTNIFNKNKKLKDNVIIAVSNRSGDGASGIQHSSLSATREEIYRFTDIIFSSNPKDHTYFLGQGVDNAETIRAKFGRLKPCVHGSDAHTLERICYPCAKYAVHDCTNDSANCELRYTWIKADPTFEGFKQIIYEPKDRIFIGRENPGLFGHAVVDSFNSSNENEKFFLKKIGNIFFNPGLNCVIGSRGSGKSTLLDAVAHSLGDADVLDEKRNNYIGFFFRRNAQGIITANVKHSSAGENKELSPNKAKDSGFLFDYYHQKQIGYLADPNNEGKLSRFIFEKIFQEDTGVSLLFNKLKKQRDTFASELAINREKVVGHEKEISKEDEVLKKIKDKNSRAEFLTQPAIKNLLAERNKIIKLREKIIKVKNRLENIEEKPLISDTEAVDTNFFNDLLLSKIDPEGTFLPTEWKDLEKEASSFLESLVTNKEELKKQIGTLTAKIIELEPSFDFNERLNTIWEEIKTESAKQNITIKKDDLGKLDSIQKDILTLEEQLDDIKEHKKEKQTLLKERKRFLDGYIVYLNSRKKKLEESFKKLLEGAGVILKGTIKLEIETVFPIEFYLECIQEKVVHDSEDDLHNFPNRKPLLELFKSLGSEKVIISFRRNNFDNWIVPGLGARSLDYFKKIKNKEEVAMHLEELLPDLTSRLLWRPDLTKEFKPLKNCSVGERGTALLSIILISGAEPLIIDQPEDDLDHFYLYKTLTPIIREVKKRRQLIFATHDANIVVNSDAELIFIVITEDGEFGDITSTSIENLATREKVMDVLEGSKTAFIRREKKYGLK